jgi:hypothetical protein
MKYILLVLIFIFSSELVLAKGVCNSDCDETESFYTKKEQSQVQEANTKEALSYLEKQKGKSNLKNNASDQGRRTAKKRAIKTYANLESNLPDYFQDEDQPENPSFTKPWRVVGTTEQTRIYGLNPGLTAMARITQDILVSPTVPQPILAEIVTGPFKGAKLLGEATIEKDLHRVLVKFHRITHDGDQIKVAANTLDYSGKIGITGDYIAEDKALITGSFLSTFLSGFTDSSIDRHRNAAGDYVDEPTVNNQAKKGLAATLSKAADRMETRANQMPGYTTVKAPVLVQVVFEEVRQ